ncbi:hypothetical protein GCM10009836_24170 [Pseudonocardia ailaonensis]|uniref:Uncharacterized protein n=1 Tax=Pseudonocardia ailaonensis TaxID=367279 RepID=A0ABN2MZL7_9PSEU
MDLRKEPVTRVTRMGTETAAGAYEFDVIVYSTGFDAITGALLRIDIRDRDGVSLRDHWTETPVQPNDSRQWVNRACWAAREPET